MNVETYEVTETSATGTELLNDPEALEIISSLGLKGQEKFTKEDVSGIKTRAPYRLMTTTEYRVYSVLLPDRQELSAYDGQMIPLRVLQVAAHAKQIAMFNQIEVWHCEGKDDPLLVGNNETYFYSRPEQRKSFILARWGEILKPVEELLVEAKKVIASNLKAMGQDALAIISPLIESPEIRAEAFLRTGKLPDPIYFQFK